VVPSGQRRKGFVEQPLVATWRREKTEPPHSGPFGTKARRREGFVEQPLVVTWRKEQPEPPHSDPFGTKGV